MDDSDIPPDPFTEGASPASGSLTGAGASYSFPSTDIALQTYPGGGSDSSRGLSFGGTGDGNFDGQSAPDGQFWLGGTKIFGEKVAQFGIPYFTALRDGGSPDSTDESGVTIGRSDNQTSGGSRADVSPGSLITPVKLALGLDDGANGGSAGGMSLGPVAIGPDGQSGPDGQVPAASQPGEQRDTYLGPTGGNALPSGDHPGVAPFTAPSGFTLGGSGWGSFDRTLSTNDGRLSTNPGSLPSAPTDQLMDTDPKIPGASQAIDSFEKGLQDANIAPVTSREPTGQQFYENYPQEENIVRDNRGIFVPPDKVISAFHHTIKSPGPDATCAVRVSSAVDSSGPGYAFPPNPPEKNADGTPLHFDSYHHGQMIDSTGKVANVGVVELASEMSPMLRQQWGDPDYQLDSADDHYAGQIGDILNNLDLGDVAVVARQGHTYMMTKGYQDQYAYTPNYNAGPMPRGKTSVWILHTPAGR